MYNDTIDDDKVMDFMAAKTQLEQEEFLKNFSTPEYLEQLQVCEMRDVKARDKLNAMLKHKEYRYRIYYSKHRLFYSRKKKRIREEEIKEIRKEIDDLDVYLNYSRQEISMVKFYLGIEE